MLDAIKAVLNLWEDEVTYSTSVASPGEQWQVAKVGPTDVRFEDERFDGDLFGAGLDDFTVHGAVHPQL